MGAAFLKRKFTLPETLNVKPLLQKRIIPRELRLNSVMIYISVLTRDIFKEKPLLVEMLILKKAVTLMLKVVLMVFSLHTDTLVVVVEAVALIVYKIIVMLRFTQAKAVQAQVMVET